VPISPNFDSPTTILAENNSECTVDGIFGRILKNLPFPSISPIISPKNGPKIDIWLGGDFWTVARRGLKPQF
jgi:hypothetical protein